jgi:hypothetical protein
MSQYPQFIPPSQSPSIIAIVSPSEETKEETVIKPTPKSSSKYLNEMN